jgi:putative transposase
MAIWVANYRVYGVRKMWKALGRAGETVGRDQVARLMRELGIQGVVRGRRVRTTRPDERADRPPDLVKRKFTAERPNALWVTDLTYVATWAGMVDVCFIVDVFSRTIVGWRVATNMRTDMVLDALEMARWSRGCRLEGLICHSDAGSQFTSIRYTERLDDIGARPSIGSVADSYDCSVRVRERAVQDRADPRPRPGPVAHRRRRRARHARLGPLVQPPAPPRSPR